MGPGVVGDGCGALTTGPWFPHLLNADDVSTDLTGLQERGSQHLAHNLNRH